MQISSELGNVEIQDMLKTIDKYTQDQDAIVKLLYLMPNQRQGMGMLMEAMFSSNIDIAKLAAMIIDKLNRCQVGKIAV